MNEDERSPAPRPNLDFVSDHLKKALDNMAAVTALIEELKTAKTIEERNIERSQHL